MLSLAELAERLGARLVGEGDCRVSRVATLTSAGEGDIAFITNKRYRNQLAETHATAVLLTEADLEFARGGVYSLVVEDPYLAYAHVASWLNPEPDEGSGVHPTAVVDAAAEVHASAWIGPQCVIEVGAVILPHRPRLRGGPRCRDRRRRAAGGQCYPLPR